MTMGGALLTRKEEQLKQQLQEGLDLQMQQALQKKDSGILEVQNSTIKKIQKLNIEYKYAKSTQNMIRDGGTSQVKSMLGALQYIGVLN